MGSAGFTQPLIGDTVSQLTSASPCSAKETRAASLSDARPDEQKPSSDQENLTGEEQNPPDKHTQGDEPPGERGLGGRCGSAALQLCSSAATANETLPVCGPDSLSDGNKRNAQPINPG